MSSNDIQSSESIRLKVVGTDEDIVYFKVKMNATLGKLMESYSNLKGISLTSTRFFYDGKQINATDTPEQLDMDDGDEILL